MLLLHTNILFDYHYKLLNININSLIPKIVKNYYTKITLICKLEN